MLDSLRFPLNNLYILNIFSLAAFGSNGAISAYSAKNLSTSFSYAGLSSLIWSLFHQLENTTISEFIGNKCESV